MDRATDKKGEQTSLHATANGNTGTSTNAADGTSASPPSPSYIPPDGGFLWPLTCKPILTFGVIADIQYAPIPDGFSFNGRNRYYRHALDATKHAARAFEDKGVCAVVNLGDMIDGKCQEINECGGDEAAFLLAGGEEEEAVNNVRYEEDDDDAKDPAIVAIDVVLRALSVYKCGPIFHTYGNHELYNFGHETIQRKLQIPFVKEPSGDLVGYYTRLITPIDNGTTITTGDRRKLRLVVLDCYDIALLQRQSTPTKTSPKHTAAVQILAANNPNFSDNPNSPQGMIDDQRRFVAFNGGMDTPQLTWLRDTLEAARGAEETVLIMTHQPILPASTMPVCLVWNYPEVLDLLREYAGVVAASFSGHAHMGGYGRDASGIHFRVFEAALESDDPVKTYGFVDMYGDRLVVRGVGDCEDAVYDLSHLEY